jgi:hypothetical protein
MYGKDSLDHLFPLNRISQALVANKFSKDVDLIFHNNPYCEQFAIVS